MRISKSKAIKLIDEKIKQFKKILENATYENRYGNAYHLAYYGTEDLLTDLFSKDEAKNFHKNVSSIGIFSLGGPIDYAQELRDYKKYINKCIAQLQIYRERIQNFWEAEEPIDSKKTKIIPFVSMSFSEPDRDINQYFIDILKALQIKFVTGERYSKDNIPEKVRKRITESDLVIIIFVKRDKLENGKYIPPSWLIKERGIAQGAGKDVIALVEDGIDKRYLAGLHSEKEIIYFEQNNVMAMRKATIRFMEALKEHKLI